jgi:CBS domain-containing protein
MESTMTVARILAAKGRDVVTAQPHRTVRDIAELLAQKNIGVVVIVGNNDEILGMASERDIVRLLARRGADGLEDAVSAHMTTQVVSTDESATLDSVMEQMTAGRFRHLPVLRHGRLVGLVSIGDVVKQRLEAIETERRALHEYIATA